MKNFIKLVLLGGFVFSLCCFIALWGADKQVKKASSEYIYSESHAIPHNKVGLLLGTGKFLQSGHVNLYYKYRIDATLALFKAQKIDYILVSGDNSRNNYDEPSTIKNDLIARGIPEDRIFLDYAGFRTLDSIVRSDKIFGQKSLTIISQQFHNERAIFIAHKKGIDAIAYNAKDVSINYGIKVQIREKFARVKTMLDLVFRKKPKFLGEKVKIQ